MDFSFFNYIDYKLFFGLLGIVLMVIGFLLLIRSSTAKSDKLFEISAFTLIASFVSFTIGFICYTQSPTAIDVYKHNTELKVKYVGEEAVDSVVVFNKRKKPVKFEKIHEYNE